MFKLYIYIILNIRKEGNTKSSIVGYLKNGDYIYATSVSNGWAKFYKGFVSAKYLLKVNTGGSNYVTTDNLHFRTGPSKNHQLITTLKKGTTVTYFAKDPFTSTWAVTNRGYASAIYLKNKSGGQSTSNTNTNTSNKTSTSGNISQRTVIDISKYNTKEVSGGNKYIQSYATTANNVDGVIIRCGFRGFGSSGSLQPDPYLDTHYNGFKDKTKIGYYFFTQAKTTAEAESEATYVVNTLLKGKKVDFPIYWDSEISGDKNGNGRADHLSKATRTACAIAFINKIKALGYRAGVYASQSWFQSQLDLNQLINAGASIWVAKYKQNDDGKPNGQKPTTSQYDGWQYTEHGKINGVVGNVDVSLFYKNVAGW